MQGRDEGRFLFSTIAYQLTLNVPGLRPHVNRIMELDPSLHTKSMDVQLQSLIVNALNALSPLPQCSYLVIIDGLDECHDKATQQMILRLLCETITVHKLPLPFLIGSHPDSQIRDSFDQKSIYNHSSSRPWWNIWSRKRYLGVSTRWLCENLWRKFYPVSHGTTMAYGRHYWSSCPTIIGQFIYATTVLKFVGADFCSPTKQLEHVLKPLGFFRPRPIGYTNIICLSKRSEYCPSSRIHHRIW